MIAPHGAESFTESIRMGIEVFHALKSVLKSKGLSTGVGDEGGFAPDLKSNVEAVEMILEGIHKAVTNPVNRSAFALIQPQVKCGKTVSISSSKAARSW